MEKEKPRQPDYTGNISAAAWVKEDKNGNPFITISVGGVVFNLFKNLPKEEKKSKL